MQLDRQSKPPRRLEHPRRLLAGKRDTLHEGIDGIGEARLRDRRQHLPADEIDVAILVAIGFGRQRMRAEKRRADRNRPLPAEAARGRQLPHLGLGVQAVAGLDLDRGDALADQRVEPRQRAVLTSSASLALRVAATVETMPPPARAISS